MAHAAIEASLAEDEQRLAECVHAMLAHPIRAGLCMWALVHACQAMATTLASSMDTNPAEAWRVAKAIAEDHPPVPAIPVTAQTPPGAVAMELH
jgi:hypothetical protein